MTEGEFSYGWLCKRNAQICRATTVLYACDLTVGRIANTFQAKIASSLQTITPTQEAQDNKPSPPPSVGAATITRRESVLLRGLFLDYLFVGNDLDLHLCLHILNSNLLILLLLTVFVEKIQALFVELLIGL